MAMSTREVPNADLKTGRFVRTHGAWFQLDRDAYKGHGHGADWYLPVVDWEGHRMVLNAYGDTQTVLVDGTPSAWKPSYLRSKARRKISAANDLFDEAQRLERRASAIEKGN